MVDIITALFLIMCLIAVITLLGISASISLHFEDILKVLQSIDANTQENKMKNDSVLAAVSLLLNLEDKKKKKKVYTNEKSAGE